MNRVDLVTIRDFVPDDTNFILATWLRNLYYSVPLFREIPKRSFMEAYHSILCKLLASPSTEIKVSCLKSDPDVILGYSVYSPDGECEILHFVFVKSAWRRTGIAKSLMPSNVWAVTHLTPVGKSLKPNNWVYNPFLLT